ncbi:MAG: hypothetical protein AAF191_08260 [Verrucomicrobiota bacterium]
MDHSTPHAPSASWRTSASSIIEELFPVCDRSGWDDLLELRGHLHSASSWESLFSSFLACRHRFERDHYLPFYRLRKLLSCSFRLEVCLGCECVSVCDLKEVLRDAHRDFQSLKRSVEHHCFEHDLGIEDPAHLEVQLTEIA